MIRQRYSLLAIFWLALLQWSTSQTFDFKTYDSSIGLPQNYIYSVKQDFNGFLWVATGEGISRYDGVSFTVFTERDSVADNFTRIIYVDKESELVWLGHNNGALSVYDGKGFKKIVIPDALAPIRGLCAGASGTLWALEQNNGLIRIGSDKKTECFFDRKKFGRNIYTAIAQESPTSLLIGTSDGLQRMILGADGTPKSLEFVEGSPSSSINCIIKRPFADDEFWVGTEDNGFFKYNAVTKKVKSYAEDTSCINHQINKTNVQIVQEDTDGNLLLGTWGKGVFKLHYDASADKFDYSIAFQQENGLSNNYVKDIMLDRENNVWFATYGGGVVALTNDYFMFYNFDEIGLKNNRALSVLRDGSNLWVGLDNGLLRTDPHCFADHEYYDAALGLPNDAVTALCKTGDGVIWAATASHGLYKKEKSKQRFQSLFYSHSAVAKKINGMATDQQNIYLATNEGFFVIDVKTQKAEAYTTENGLPHNSINFVFVEQGKVWLAPKDNGITLFKGQAFEVHRLAQSPVNVSGMSIDKEARIWLSTYNRGILCYTSDTLINITVQDGLEKNYCYGITTDSHNRVWVAHQPGMSSYSLSTKMLRRFGVESQLNANFQQIYQDPEGEIWFASDKGVVKYLPTLDRENIYPPILNFVNIDVSGITYHAGQTIDLPYQYNKRPYLFSFDFVGISFKNPGQVTYEYCLIKDGSKSDEKWIPLKTSGHKELDYLQDGDYTFMVRAYNSDGMQSITPLVLDFSIQAPFWKKGWFYILFFLFAVTVTYFLIKYRERHLRLQKQMLEAEVASQTVELREQKAVIEQKNRDITDSINYAKRIQRSILPPLSNLQSSLKESFIFFKPRDIVSGDFYWFTRKDDKIIICCADCTGHGVPGAFMSMIGTTILNDIFKIPEVNSPAAMLERLDKELKIMLHRNNEIETEDGMDIAVVEIDLSNFQITAASARRPVYFVLEGQFVEYKGNRRSIGAKGYDQWNHPFNNIVYQGKTSDMVYLFSDGYSDQFGGTDGKKLMTSGVKKLVQHIWMQPVKKQEEAVVRAFYDWMGDLDQIDDVIFMGIRLS